MKCSLSISLMNVELRVDCGDGDRDSFKKLGTTRLITGEDFIVYFIL
jgi:hypothetical protein